MMINMNMPPIWAEIDLQSIAHNCQAIRRLIGPDTEIMAVVKADGYGHGAVQTAQTVLENGASQLGVARAHEGIELRKSGIKAPILVFGYTSPQDTKQLIDYDLIQTLYDLKIASAFSQAAVSLNKYLKVQIKIDTGMGRLGLMAMPINAKVKEPVNPRCAQDIQKIYSMPGLVFQGIYTHFARADHIDKRHTQEQLDCFLHLTNSLEKSGYSIPNRHAANSAAVLDLPETYLDMVRPGIILYGLYPSRHVDHSKIQLQPAMTLKTRIAQLKDVPKGYPISYGSTYTTRSPTKLATLAVGYSDGYKRLLSSRGEMLVHGQRAPVVGRICMDQVILDIGHIEGVTAEDEVVIFGKQKGNEISVNEIAEACSTINYEIVSTIMARVPRIYNKDQIKKPGL